MKEEPLVSPRAIVPGDADRQLILPEDLIHRGLELAIRIEQKQVIKPFPSKPTTKEYTVQCYLSMMEWSQRGDRSYKLSESSESITNRPVYLVLSVDQDGLHVSCASTNKNEHFIGVEGNKDRYRLLNASNSLDPFTIPASAFGLFYTLSHPMEKSSLSSIGRLPKEKLKGVKFNLSPSGQPGYKGPITKKANPFFHIDRDCVEIVVVYVSIFGDPNLKQGLVAKNPPLKLTFVAIDQKGEDDPVASYELYHTLLDIKNPRSATK